ncbi:RES family NAD+ phosphorylase [Algoriphagus sp.]|uniref:RES family NAD+ phosphorylase n=1 Tax=Algoriphagus sp. TaxID=1872435 RepID=UPI003F7042BA
MKYCSIDIFLDPSLGFILESLALKIGDCNYTAEKNTALVSLGQVGEKLENIFSLYQPTDPEEEGVILAEHLIDYWPGLFDMKRISVVQLSQLLKDIFKDADAPYNGIGEGLVRFIPEKDKSYQDFANDLSSRWEKLSNELKYQNRFFLSEAIDWDSISTTLEMMAKTHAKGNSFFRARISEEPIDCKHLGKPPRDKASPGRANPVGIPYLYLATDQETTYYEARAGLHEQIFMGEFEALENLNVVSLERIEFLGPIEIQERGFDLEEFIRYRAFLMKLSQELSRPIRKKDSDFDYLPTQYLCEFIKSLGFDGVQYQSAMNPTGSNLAIFNDQKLQCVGVKTLKVDQVEYSVSENMI